MEQRAWQMEVTAKLQTIREKQICRGKEMDRK